MRRAGLALFALVVAVAVGAPWLAPNDPERAFSNLLYAPPTPVHAGAGGLYIHPQRLVSRLERRFEQDTARRAPLQWLTNGRLVSVDESQGGPLLVLGADVFGRDTFSRLIFGARTSLALAVLATAGALILGALVGGVAGYAGGRVDELLSRFSEFVLVLPAIYVALALRAVMPLVLPAETVFVALTVIFALLGWPIVARGVRAIVASERDRDYAAAALAAGAGPVRTLVLHLLPAAWSYLTVQATLLLPAFILAEATLSYVGLGFPDTVPTWGTMLQDAANVSLVAEAPWMLAPAAAIFIFVLAVNLTVQSTGRAPVQLEP
ncbi:MAG: ABC transporter permease [Acidimicrobiia bacterium]|nr:ABC transporter permease [Acidimicrobiia bacterium]